MLKMCCFEEKDFQRLKKKLPVFRAEICSQSFTPGTVCLNQLGSDILISLFTFPCPMEKELKLYLATHNLKLC